MFFPTLLEVSFIKLPRWTAVPPDKTLTSRDMKQAFGAFAIVVLVCQSLCGQGITWHKTHIMSVQN